MVWFKDRLVVEEHNNDVAGLPIAPAVLCEHVSLVIHRAAAVTEAALDSLSATTGVVNFKRFKKVKFVLLNVLVSKTLVLILIII